MVSTYTTSNTFTEISPNASHKELIVVTPSTIIASDIVQITLADHGFSSKGLLTVSGYRHTTANSVVVVDNPVTSVTTGVLSLSIAAAVPTKWTRVFRIVGDSN